MFASSFRSGSCRRHLSQKCSKSVVLAHQQRVQASRHDGALRRQVVMIPVISTAIGLLEGCSLAFADDSEIESATGRRVFFDVSIDGKTEGKVVIEMFNDAVVGSQRFYDLSIGKQGVGYRRSKFDAIYPVRVENSRALSFRLKAAL